VTIAQDARPKNITARCVKASWAPVIAASVAPAIALVNGDVSSVSTSNAADVSSGIGLLLDFFDFFSFFTSDDFF
jgi:hypothetical protein